MVPRGHHAVPGCWPYILLISTPQKTLPFGSGYPVSTPRLNGLMTKITWHYIVGRVKCSKCLQEFEFLHDLWIHIDNQHKVKRTPTILKHKWHETWTNPSQMDGNSTPSQMTNKSILIRPPTGCKKPLQMTCNYKGCGAIFQSKFALSEHLHTHYKCPVKECFSSFDNRLDLDNHVISHRQLTCDFQGCQAKYWSVSSLLKHSKTHYKCPNEECCSSFSNR